MQPPPACCRSHDRLSSQALSHRLDSSPSTSRREEPASQQAVDTNLGLHRRKEPASHAPDEGSKGICTTGVVLDSGAAASARPPPTASPIFPSQTSLPHTARHGSAHRRRWHPDHGKLQRIHGVRHIHGLGGSAPEHPRLRAAARALGPRHHVQVRRRRGGRTRWKERERGSMVLAGEMWRRRRQHEEDDGRERCRNERRAGAVSDNARRIADRAQICTQYVSKRPPGVAAMVFGIDDEKETPQLFTCDPAGYFLGHKAASVGHKDGEAVNFLEKKMKNNPSLSFPETIQMAISALQFALKEDLKSTEIEVGVVRKDDPTFRVLTAAEIDEHLKAINPGKQS